MSYFNMADYIARDGTVLKYTSIGSYPLYYITADGGVLSSNAVQENLDLCKDSDDSQWYVVGVEANWEDPALCCDHTGERIESAYAEGIAAMGA